MFPAPIPPFPLPLCLRRGRERGGSLHNPCSFQPPQKPHTKHHNNKAELYFCFFASPVPPLTCCCYASSSRLPPARAAAGRHTQKKSLPLPLFPPLVLSEQCPSPARACVLPHAAPLCSFHSPLPRFFCSICVGLCPPLPSSRSDPSGDDPARPPLPLASSTMPLSYLLFSCHRTCNNSSSPFFRDGAVRGRRWGSRLEGAADCGGRRGARGEGKRRCCVRGLFTVDDTVAHTDKIREAAEQYRFFISSIAGQDIYARLSTAARTNSSNRSEPDRCRQSNSSIA